MSVAEHVQRWQANMGSPTRLPLEINPYAYVANNPLRWIDPTGEAADGAAIGGTIGGVLGGLIGGLGGGAACTVVAPGVGTVACGGGGAVQGALEGATIGAMIGSKIEDICTNKADRTTDCNAAFGRCYNRKPNDPEHTNRCAQALGQCLNTDLPVLFPHGEVVQ